MTSADKPVDSTLLSAEEWIDAPSDVISLRHAGGETVDTKDLKINVNIDGKTYVYSSANISENLGGKSFWELADIIQINTSQEWGVGIADEKNVDVKLIDTRSKEVLPKYRIGFVKEPSQMGLPVVADFIAVPSSGVAPLSVNFTDLSTGSPTSWQWNFGDGSSNSTLQNPDHVFTNPGVYNVTLTVAKSGYSSTKTKVITAITPTAITPVVADFSANPTNGTAPLSVNFTDLSTGSPTSWQWNFGDGSSNSSLQNPSHVFTNAGIYNVTLTAMKTGSGSSITKNLTVNNFNITGDVVVPKDNFKCNFTVLGAQISYGGDYNMMVTTQLYIGNQTYPLGNYSSPVGSNVNDNKQHQWNLPASYPAGTPVTISGRSWSHNSSGLNYSLDSSWTQHMEVKTTGNSPNLIVLKNGDSVPDKPGYLGQASLATFVAPYIKNGKISLKANEAIFLFELGTTDTSSNAADFQDLVVLMSVQKVP
jgi:PKD repeat protein